MRHFFMDAGQARMRLAQLGAILVTAAVIGGCGNSYRPVITPISTSGPAPEVSGYVVVVSDPSPTTDGVATILDYSGDTILAEAPVGLAPKYFSVDGSGTVAATYNSDNTITDFPVTANLQTLYETEVTLPATAAPVNFLTQSGTMWVADQYGSYADYFSGYNKNLTAQVPVGTSTVPAISPVAVIGNSAGGGQRVYAISQNFSDTTGVACNLTPTTEPTGVATPIELASQVADTPIPVGVCPVYAVTNSGYNRIFVLNRGDDTISVINNQLNAPDSCAPYLNQNGQTVYCHPTLPLSLSAVSRINASAACAGSTLPPCGGPPNGTAGMPTTAGPVYAEYNAASEQLVVADYVGGTISVINVAVDEYGNDGPSFGDTYTIPVGTNPAAVTALADGSRAYVANQADGTVTVVDLPSYSVEKTLAVEGHPRTVVSTQNSLQGNVYVASPDSPYITIISTENDLVATTVLVEGNVVDVRVNTENGASGNSNTTSRAPGWGEPCNLPPTLLSNATLSTTPSQCSAMP